MSLRVVFLASVAVACSAVAVYDPPDAGVALDAVEKALQNIVKSPHLTKTQLAQAKKVSEDVESTVTFLESAEGKKLTKDARAAKVKVSIKELQDLQTMWTKEGDKMIATQKTKLMEEMKKKEEELVKDKKLLKVLNLQKALAEKKLALQKLIEQKKDAAATKEAEKQAAQLKEMVGDMESLAKDMVDKKKPADDKVKPVMAYLEDRVKKAAAKLDDMDAANKKQEAEFNGMVTKKMPAQDKQDPLVKAQGVLKMLMKKQHRQFLKARVPLDNELKELKSAVTAITKNDAASLTKVVAQMQGDMKTAQAKSHKFLY